MEATSAAIFFVRIAARLNHVPSDLPSVDACGTARRLAVGSTREFDARRCVGRGCNIGHSDQPERFWLPWEVHTAQRDSRNPARPQLGQSPQACGWATSGPRYPGKWIVQSCLAIPGAVTAVHFPNTQGGKSRKSRITYYRCKDHLSFLVYRKSGVNIYVKYVMASSNQFTPKLFLCAYVIRDLREITAGIRPDAKPRPFWFSSLLFRAALSSTVPAPPSFQQPNRRTCYRQIPAAEFPRL